EADDIIAKVTAQACYQAGVGGVFQDLLNFKGDEIYFADASPVVGRRFADAMLAYETSTLVGRVKADGTLELAPPMETVFEKGDQVMALSADDDTIVFTGFRPAGDTPGNGQAMPAAAPSHLLIVGWSDLGALVLRHLQGFADRPAAVDVLVADSL